MIAQLVDVLNAAASGLPVDTRHGIAHPVAGRPHVHVGDGQFVPVATDLSGSWSYLRVTAPVRVERMDIGEPCDGARVSIALRLVALLRRDQCEELGGLMLTVSSSIRGARKVLRTALGATHVEVQQTGLVMDGVVSREFTPAVTIPAQWVLVAFDLSVVMDGREECFAGCGEITDVVCAIIAGASDAKIIECLGSRLAELCGHGGPCPPTTVNGTESDTPTITVTQGGDPVGTLDPATGVVTVPPCPPPDPCDPVTVRTTDGVTNIATPASGTNYDVPQSRIKYKDTADVSQKLPASNTEFDATNLLPATEIPRRELFDDKPTPLGLYVTAADLLNDTVPQVPAPPPCADANVNVNATPFGTVPSGGTLNVPVVNRDLAPVGAIVGPNWQVENGEIFTTDGLTLVGSAAPEGTTNQQQSVIKYKDAADASQVTAASNTEFASGTLRPATEVPRRELFNDTPAPLGLYVTVADLLNNTVPQVPSGDLCTLLGAVTTANTKTQVYDCLAEGPQYTMGIITSLDRDAAAYIAKVEQADNDWLEWEVRKAIYDFVIGLKADGTWADIEAACIMSGARTLAGSLIPLKGPAPTPFNFVGADYHRTGGIKGNASNKYLDTNRNNNADGQNDNHNAVFINTEDDTLTSTGYMGAGVADNGTNLVGKSGTPPYNAVVRNRTNVAFTAGASGTGLLGISRSAAANYTLRVAGADQTVTQVSQTPISANLFVFGRNSAGTVNIPSNARLNFYSIGAAINLAQLDTRVAALNAALVAAIP